MLGCSGSVLARWVIPRSQRLRRDLPVLTPHLSALGEPGAERLRKLPANAPCDEPLLHTASRPKAWPDWVRAMGLPPEPLQQAQTLPHLYFLLEAAAAGWAWRSRHKRWWPTISLPAG